MDIEEIICFVRGLDGALVVVAEPGGPFPPAAWGDVFFFHSPSGALPKRGQPYATITTADSPGDTASRRDAPGGFRVNIHVGRERAAQLTDRAGHPAADGPGDSADAPADGAGGETTGDAAATDVLRRHPIYGAAGWVCIACPTERSAPRVRALLRAAHEDARARTRRRQEAR